MIIFRKMMLAAAMLLGLITYAAADSLPTVEVYKNKGCGCCEAWVEHLRKNGFAVKTHDVDDVKDINTKFGVSNQYASCHTAKVGSYFIVGHVPAADIKRLLNQNPKALGLAVPGMPAGSPGMESANPVHYDSLLLKQNGEATAFQHH